MDLDLQGNDRAPARDEHREHDGRLEHGPRDEQPVQLLYCAA
jgi:hypothetical protein